MYDFEKSNVKYLRLTITQFIFQVIFLFITMSSLAKYY